MQLTDQSKQWASVLWKFAFVVLSVLAISYLLPYFLTRPGEIMTELGGDTAKNYYTVLYHALYGGGIWFDGMNYPYGEHASFVDGQPILSASLAYVRNFLPLSAGDVLAVMHLLIFFSYVAGAVYVYKILRFFKLPRLASGLFALLIICMSPQVPRIYSHFGLSYGCLLPMLFYWLLRYQHSSKTRYAVAIVLTGAVASFLHPYWSGIYGIWCMSYVLAYTALQRAPWRVKARHAGKLLAATIFMLLIVNVTMQITDPATDRTREPVGFFKYTADTKDIVTSPASPVWARLSQEKLVTDISNMGEGYAYIGLAAMFIFLIAGVVHGLRYRRRKATTNNNPVEPGLSWIWVAVALLALMLSSGAPFNWGMEWLLDYMPVFRQFRSLGRFTWIFYYISVTYAAVLCWRLYLLAECDGRSVLSRAVLLLPICLWAYEAKSIAAYFRLRAGPMPWFKQAFFGEAGQENWRKELAKKGYEATDFQAVMMLPFFHIGSDKVALDNYHSGWAVGLTVRAAFNLHLPMVNVMSSRTSWSQTFGQVRTVGGPYTDKPLLRHLPNNKPLLTLVHREDGITRDESYLLQSAEYITTILNCDVYALYPDRLRMSDSQLKTKARQIAGAMAVGDTCIGAGGNTWTVLHYDSLPEPHSVWGGGSMPLTGNWTELIQMPVQPTGDTTYEVSVWVKVNDRNADAPTLKIYVIDSMGTYWTDYAYHANRSTDFYGFWFRISAYVPLPRQCRVLKCVIENGTLGYRIDELMIRPAAATIISRSQKGNTIMVNNHRLTMP